MKAAMLDLSRTLPDYTWLVALPQLVSRICHPQKDVVDLTKELVATVLKAYPQQVSKGYGPHRCKIENWRVLQSSTRLDQTAKKR